MWWQLCCSLSKLTRVRWHLQRDQQEARHWGTHHWAAVTTNLNLLSCRLRGKEKLNKIFKNGILQNFRILAIRPGKDSWGQPPTDGSYLVEYPWPNSIPSRHVPSSSVSMSIHAGQLTCIHHSPLGTSKQRIQSHFHKCSVYDNILYFQ